jgi:hypothetical protein
MKTRRSKHASDADRASPPRLKPSRGTDRLSPERPAGDRQERLALTLSGRDTAGDQAAMRFLQQHLGNATVARLAAANAFRGPGRATAVRPLQRAPDPNQKSQGSTAVKDRAQAEALLQQRWKVGSVVEGTAADQEKRLTTFSMNYFNTPKAPADVGKMLATAGWKPWSPASGSPIWQWLVEAFKKFDRVFGGVPSVKDIGFYETEYQFLGPDKGGPLLTPDATVGADFGGGSMAIYHVAETTAGNGRVALTRSDAAPAATPSPGASGGFEFSVMHEMGHGLIEAVHQVVSKDTLANYGAAVGWYKGRLFDGQATEVQEAIGKDTPPEAKFQITQSSWDAAKWKEQPLSKYMASALSEDFPEAVAAYIAQPAALKARSPLRFKFIDDNKTSFLPAVQKQVVQAGGGAANP